MSFLSEISSGVAIFLTVLAILLAAPAIWLLIRGILRDRAKFAENKVLGGALNKSTFDTFLKARFQSATKRTHFTVFYLEINEAKNMKASFGDAQYGNAIKEMIGRIEKIFPSVVKVCQYEYDTVAVFADQEFTPQEVEDLASFILIEVKKPYQMAGGLQLEMDVNMGIASYNNFNSTFEQLWQNIELALLVSKRAGVNQYTVHSAELNNQESEEYQYYEEIKDAMEAGEFTLYYQPIVDVLTGENFGFESLLRWNHRTLGVVPPGQFLNVLEQSGDIVWVGNWAFEQLLKQRVEWAQRFPDKKLVLSMNLSPKQLMSDKLCDDMRRIQRKYRVDPAEICIEVVEFAMFDKMSIVKENIDRIHKMGYKIAIDDYGLEMNTLSMLQEINVDIIKLDRKFIMRAQEDTLSSGLVGTLTSFAKEKEILIVAEGIEDEYVLDFVKNLGIPLGQGYFFAKPSSPKELII